MAEQGFDVAADAWIGLLAAPHTPRATAEAVHEAVSRVQQTAGFQEAMRTNGFSKLGHGPAEFQKFLAAGSERWGRAVKEGNIRVEG